MQADALMFDFPRQLIKYAKEGTPFFIQKNQWFQGKGIHRIYTPVDTIQLEGIIKKPAKTEFVNLWKRAMISRDLSLLTLLAEALAQDLQIGFIRVLTIIIRLPFD